MGSPKLHPTCFGIAKRRQKVNGFNRICATRRTPTTVYKIIRLHPTVHPDEPFVFVRDYNTLAIGFRCHFLRRRQAKRCRSEVDLYAAMAAAETKYMERRDGEIRAVFGSDTPIINVVDGSKRPKAKMAMKGPTKKTSRALQCGTTIDDALDASRHHEWFQPAYLSEPSEHVVVRAEGEADTAIEHLLRKASERRSGQLAQQEPNEEVELIVSLLAAIPETNLVVQSNDGDDLIRNSSLKRHWTVSLFWTGKMADLDLDEHDAGDRAAPVLVSQSRADELGVARPRHVLWHHVGLDEVFGTADEEVRMKMALCCGQDYTGRGIPGITWAVALSGIAEALFRLDWSSRGGASAMQHVLNRLASNAERDQLWRRRGRHGRIKRAQPTEVDNELLDCLREGLVTFRGSDPTVPMVDALAMTAYGRGSLDFSDRAPAHIRHPRPQSAEEQQAADMAEERKWRVRPNVDFEVDPNPLARQALPTVDSNPRLEHPDRLTPPTPPTATPEGSFPATPRVIRQVCWGPGPNLVEEAINRPAAEPEIIPGGEAPDDQPDAEDDGDGDDNGEWAASIFDGVDAKATKKAQARRPQLSSKWAVVVSPVRKRESALRKIILTNVALEEAPPGGCKTIPILTARADAEGAQPPHASATPPIRSLDAARLAVDEDGDIVMSDDADMSSDKYDGTGDEDDEADDKKEAGDDGRDDTEMTASDDETTEVNGQGVTGAAPTSKRRRRKNRCGSTKKRGRQEWLFSPYLPDEAGPKEGSPKPAQPGAGSKQAPPLVSTNPRTVSDPPGATPSPASPHYLVTSLQPLLDLLLYVAHSGMPFLRALVAETVVAGLNRGEAGHVELGKLAKDQSDLKQTMGRMMAAVRPGGEAMQSHRDGPRYRRRMAIIQKVRAGGHLEPARLPATAWTEIVAPLQQNFEMLARQRLLKTLRSTGHFVGGNLLANLASALSLVQRAAHRDFALDPQTPAALAAIESSRGGDIFKSRLQTWFGNVLADAVYRDDRAAAGREEEPEEEEFEEEEDDDGDEAQSDEGKGGALPGESKRTLRQKTTEATQASAAAAAGKKANAPKIVPELPDFDPGGNFLDELDDMLERAFKDVSAPDRDDMREALRSDLCGGANRLLASRDGVVQLHMMVIKGRGGSQPKGAADADEDDDDEGDSGTVDGKTLKTLMRATKIVNGKELSKALWTLDALFRKMQGLSPVELAPTFSPAFDSFSSNSLLLCLDGKAANAAQERLTMIIEDIEDIATRQLGALATRLHPDSTGLLLDPLEHICTPVGATWAEIRHDPSGHADIGLAVRARFAHEVRAFRGWLRHAFDLPNGSLATLVERQGLRAEFANLVVDESSLPSGWIPTGRFVVSTSAMRSLCVDLSRAKDPGEAPISAGELYAKSVRRPFAELSATEISNRRVNDVYHARNLGGETKLVKIVPLAAADPNEMQDLAKESVFGPKPISRKPGLYGRRNQKRLNKRGLQRWSRRIHPVAVEKKVRAIIPPLKTVGGINASWGSLEDPEVRDSVKEYFADVDFRRDVPMMAIDKGKVNTIAAHLSRPTTQEGYNGRADSTLYYRSGALDAESRQNSEKASAFGNRLDAELDESVKESDAKDPPLAGTYAAMKSLNPDNDWRKVQAKVSRQAHVCRAADQLLDGLCGGIKGRSSSEEVKKTKHLVVLGDCGGKGGGKGGRRGPNPANRIVREMEVRARARGINILFVVAPETMTSQRCSKPWCVDEFGRRSKARTKRLDNGEPNYRLLHCDRCRAVFNRDAVGAANILAQAISLIWHDEPLWRTRKAEKKIGTEQARFAGLGA